MSDPWTDRPERPKLSEQDLAIAALVGRYIERRERHEAPCVHDLLAAAAEFGDTAVDVLRIVIATYEAKRLYDAAPARTAVETPDPADAPELDRLPTPRRFPDA